MLRPLYNLCIWDILAGEQGYSEEESQLKVATPVGSQRPLAAETPVNNYLEALVPTLT